MSPPDPADRPVLIAYDGSDHAKAAIEEAGRQLRTDRPALVLAVWEPLESIPVIGSHGRSGVSYAALGSGRRSPITPSARC